MLEIFLESPQTSLIAYYKPDGRTSHMGRPGHIFLDGKMVIGKTQL